MTFLFAGANEHYIREDSVGMKKKLNNNFVKFGITAFLAAAASICFYYLIFHSSNFRANLSVLSNILMPVLFGLGMGYLLTPVLNFIEYRILNPLCSKLKIRETGTRKNILRVISILFTCFLFFYLIFLLISMLLSQIVPSIESIVVNFDIYLNNITTWLNNLLADNADIRDYVIKTVSRYSGELEEWMNDVVISQSTELIKTVSLSIINLLKGLWNFILGFIISIYVLSSKESFAGQAKKIVYAVFERETANIIINNFRFIHRTFIGFVGGKILDSIIIGIICFICTTLMKTPYAALVSVVIGVTNVIPFFGPFLGAIPTTILIFVVDPSHPLNCVYFIIFILILQQFDGNVLGPRILGNSTGIAGFWVIFAITFFGGLFGVLGMIIGVPFFAVLYASIKSFINSALRKKKLPEETADYMKVGHVDENGFHQYIPDSHKSFRELKDTPENEEYHACFGDRVYSSKDDIRIDLEHMGEINELREAVKEENQVKKEKEKR